MLLLFILSGTGRIGLVLGEPTGIEYYMPAEKNALDFQTGLSYHWGYIGAFGGFEFEIADFGNITPELKNLKLYFKPGAVVNLGLWSIWYRDFLLVGPTGRIGFKLDYDKYQFFIETGPIVYVVLDFFIDVGGVIGIRF
uniref:DUF3996 domain-containing protein n=1 Tax=candidate division WOR-3 bacterium TaxID=2052148 RepID=A0A7C4UBH6_UNCW3